MKSFKTFIVLTWWPLTGNGSNTDDLLIMASGELLASKWALGQQDWRVWSRKNGPASQEPNSDRWLDSKRFHNCSSGGAFPVCSGQNRSKMLHEAISVKFIGSQGFIHVGEWRLARVAWPDRQATVARIAEVSAGSDRKVMDYSLLHTWLHGCRLVRVPMLTPLLPLWSIFCWVVRLFTGFNVLCTHLCCAHTCRFVVRSKKHTFVQVLALWWEVPLGWSRLPKTNQCLGIIGSLCSQRGLPQWRWGWAPRRDFSFCVGVCMCM